MRDTTPLDAIVIGYNETPFPEYEQTLRQYGDESEAYRDLKFSFIDLNDSKLTYIDLLNYVFKATYRDDIGLQQKYNFKSGDIPNLAAVYLVNFLGRKGFSSSYINLFQYEKERLVYYLERDPLCVAITTTFYVLNTPAIEIVKFIREHNKKTKIVVGGPLVSNHYNRSDYNEFLLALEDIGADIYVIESQGEQTLTHIVDCLKNGKDLNEIPNIVYHQGGRFQRTRIAPENNSLDENFIDWDDFSSMSLGPTIQTRTARSCAFSCAFCAYPERAGKLTLASLDTIEKELNSMRDIGTKDVVFIDDTFNVPLARFKDICRMMIRNEYNLKWFSYFRCGNSDEEAIELMARSGCTGVFLGIESGSPTILENMHKAATIEKYTKGIGLLHRYGILTFGSFISGFPGETDDTVSETVEFIRETRPDYYRSQLWYCEPGTPIYRRKDEYDVVGEGFKWRHRTMSSTEAMDHIEEMFLSIDSSVWLPQWSFDFWIIPYMLGKGISLERFKELMVMAKKLLTLEIACISGSQKQLLQQEYLTGMISMVRSWNLPL